MENLEARRPGDWTAMKRYASQNAPMDRAFGHWDIAAAYELASGGSGGEDAGLAGDFLLAGAVVWRAVPSAEALLLARAQANDPSAIGALLELSAARDAPRPNLDAAEIALAFSASPSDRLNLIRSGLAAPAPDKAEAPPAAELVLLGEESELPRLRANLERMLGRHSPAFYRHMAALLEKLGHYRAAAAQLEALADQQPDEEALEGDLIRTRIHIARLNGAANEPEATARALWCALKLAQREQPCETRALWLEQIAYTALILGQSRVGTVAYLRAAAIHGRLRGPRDIRCAVALVRAGDLLLRQGKLRRGVLILERACVGLGLDYVYQSTGAEALSYWLQGVFRLGEFDRGVNALAVFLEEKRARTGAIWPGYYVHLLNVLAQSAPPLQFVRVVSLLSGFVGSDDPEGGEDRSPLRDVLTHHASLLLDQGSGEVALSAARSLQVLVATRWLPSERKDFIERCVRQVSTVLASEEPEMAQAGAWLRIAASAADGDVHVSSSPATPGPLQNHTAARRPVGQAVVATAASVPIVGRATRIKMRLLPIWSRLPARFRFQAKPLVIGLANLLLRRRSA